MFCPPNVLRVKKLYAVGANGEKPFENKLNSPIEIPCIGPGPHDPTIVACPTSSEWKSSVTPMVSSKPVLKSVTVKTPFPADAPDTVSCKFWKAFENADPVKLVTPGLLKSEVSNVNVAVAEAPLPNCAPDHSACMSIRSARETATVEIAATNERMSSFVFMVLLVVGCVLLTGIKIVQNFL